MLLVIDVCFGATFSMYVQKIFFRIGSLVPPFGEELLCSPWDLYICNFSYIPFWFLPGQDIGSDCASSCSLLL